MIPTLKFCGPHREVPPREPVVEGLAGALPAQVCGTGLPPLWAALPQLGVPQLRWWCRLLLRAAHKPKKNQPGYQSQQPGCLNGPLDKFLLSWLCPHSEDLLCHGGTGDCQRNFKRTNRLPLTRRIRPNKLHRMPFQGGGSCDQVGVNHGQGWQSLRGFVASLWVFCQVVRRIFCALHLSKQGFPACAAPWTLNSETSRWQNFVPGPIRLAQSSGPTRSLALRPEGQRR